jgi:uncharacterized protein
VERLGTLAILRRYPVKGMAGEDVAAARVRIGGIVGDRVYAFVDELDRSSFPWMTARQAHDWLLLRPRFLNPPSVEELAPAAERYTIEVVTPEGEKFALGDVNFTQLLERRYGRSLHLDFSERAITDAAPVSLFGLATVRAIARETGLTLDPRRFRANFYVRWERDEPFYEDQFVGRGLRIGEDVTVEVVKKDQRCVIITLDSETAERSPIVLEKVARDHGGCAGVYAVVLREGVVRADDPVYLV